MIEIKSKLRKWGNSFGIIIPQKSLDKTSFKEGEEIHVFIETPKKNILKKMFGTFKFGKKTSKLLKDVDKELEDI